MPERTYIAKTEKPAGGFKAVEDCAEFLFSNNASGVKCFTPRALIGKIIKN